MEEGRNLLAWPHLWRNWWVGILVGGCGYPGVAAAQASMPINQPPINLGVTSFLDGEGGAGALLEIIGTGYMATYTTDATGRPVPGNSARWNGTVTLHPVYQFTTSLLGGSLGAEALLPLALIGLDLPGPPPAGRASRGGVGDLAAGPFVQWSKLRLLGEPLSLRLACQGVAPLGSYAREQPVNVGQHAWQVLPYCALTWRTSEKWELSSRLTYAWVGRNTQPAADPASTSAQAGQQLALNLAASRAGLPGWRVGVAGYLLKQLSNARRDDQPLPASRQQALGLGPGLLWKSGRTTLIANLYREFGTRNRSEGFSGGLRFLRTF